MVSRIPLPYKSIVESLTEELFAFTEKVENHLLECEIQALEPLYDEYVYIYRPSTGWARNDPQDQILEIALSKLFKKFWENYRSFLKMAARPS